MSLTKITGQLTDPTSFVNALYGNQSEQRAGVGDEGEIIFYGSDGTPRSSADLMFDRSMLGVTGILGVTGGLDVVGGIQQVGTSNVVEISGTLNVLGSSSVATTQNPATTPNAGPRLVYRGTTMPVYWTTIISGFCSQTSVATSLQGITGTSPNWITVNTQPFFLINGPYVSFNTTTVTTVNNITVQSNVEFYPFAAQVATSTGENAAGGSRIGSVQISALCFNTFGADCAVGILFYPIVAGP